MMKLIHRLLSPSNCGLVICYVKGSEGFAEWPKCIVEYRDILKLGITNLCKNIVGKTASLTS